MLIPSKLSRPVRLDHTVVRERLLAKLSGANNFRLALITSPAGYGKTTLISQWAAGKNDIGWYSLDEGDNQQERFASYLIAAVQQATNGHCAICETMAQKRQYASLTSLFAQLFIELAEWHSPLYLVIDDYHLITNPVIHESMRFFIRHQPENLTLVVLSRNLPQGELTRSLALMQQTEQMARQHDVWHYALWSLIQQSEILFAQGFLQTAWETQEKAFQLINEQHLEQLPMHEFLVRIRAQLLWAWARLDEAEASARSGIEVLSSYQPQQQLQCLAMLIQCSLARGDLDNARSQLNRLENLLGNGKYHSDWISNANKVRVIYWQMTGDKAAAANWLRHTAKPEFANNHFLQGQWRNIARAQILLGEFEPAEIVLEELNENARSLRLMSDLNRNLLLLNQLYWQAGRKSDAQRVLLDALKLANRTGFISHFVIEGEAMAQQLRQLIQLNTLPELEQHRAQRILREINQHHRHKFAHFDENFVERLLNHPEVPELIRTSPLTQREWQVLGLIYSGYSNEQIAGELEVAATTIKTHIRNLYQKLGVAHRQAAVQHAQKLLKMMGYGV